MYAFSDLRGSRFRDSSLCSGGWLITAGLALGGSWAAAQSTIEELVIRGDRNLARSTSVGKLDIGVTETPFSISIRDKQMMDAMGVKTVQDTLLYFAGVNGGTYGIDARGDWSTIRSVDPVVYIDGLQSLFGHYSGARAASYAFERVEVLKGPASVLYGQGSTGGIVNLVSKRPRAGIDGEFFVQGGSFERKVLGADVSGTIDAQGKWLYRAVGYARDADAQIEHVQDDSTLLMPSLSWRPTENTDLTFLYSKQADESGTTTAFLPWAGTLTPNPNGRIPTDTFLSEPGWDKYDTDQDNYSVWFQQRFNETWSLNANARYSRGTVDYNSMWIVFDGSTRPDNTPDRFASPDLRTATRTAYVSDASSEMLIADLRATAEFNTGHIQHMVSFGADSLDAESDNDTWYGYGGTIDVFNPVYGNIPTGFTINDNPYNTTEQLGVYVQDQINIGNAIVNAGFRRDEVESQSQGGTAEKDDASTRRLGLMYAFESGATPYASYTESFEPVGGANNAGVPFKPIRGEQVEVGLKYQPPGSNVLITAARYDIVQENRLESHPTDPTDRVQTGEVDFDGIELEISATWERVDLIANVSKTKASEVIEAVPEDQFSLWGGYRFRDTLEGFYMGLGVRHVGESATGIGNIMNPDYTLYDASLGYDLANWKFQLNANNLTDEIHTTSCLSRGDCFYGERRYVTAEARYRF